MTELTCNWTPSLIVEFVKAIAWPATVLLIGVSFRSRVIDSVRGFFSKNTVSEVSATTTGLSAKFVAAKQSLEAKETSGASAVSLPENMGAEAIKERHAQSHTEFSEQLYNAIKTHVAALNVSQEGIIDLLIREASLLQSAIRYFDINKVLFRSQFNLFSNMSENSGRISKSDVQSYFKAVKELVGDALQDWDWIKYVAYPVSNGLVADEGDGYKLTVLGQSYVAFMARNPQFIDELSKL